MYTVISVGSDLMFKIKEQSQHFFLECNQIRKHIEGKSQKIRRIREAEIENPIKRFSLAVIENTMLPMKQHETLHC